MKYMTLCLVAAVTSCGFNFSLDGKCFEGETYITNPNCPPPDGADSTDSVDGLDAIDSVGTTGIDTVDGMDGIDAVVDGVEPMPPMARNRLTPRMGQIALMLLMAQWY